MTTKLPPTKKIFWLFYIYLSHKTMEMFFLLTHHFLFLCGCKKGVLKKCEVLLHSVFKPKEASYACTSFCFVSTFFLFLEFVYFFLKLVYYFENLLFLFGFFSSWKYFLLLFLKFFPLELFSIYFLFWFCFPFSFFPYFCILFVIYSNALCTPNLQSCLFWGFLMIEQIFLSPQKKRSVIISNRLVYKKWLRVPEQLTTKDLRKLVNINKTS